MVSSIPAEGDSPGELTVNHFMHTILKPVFASLLFTSIAFLQVTGEVDEILDRHYEALGGLENLGRLETLSIKGVNRFQEQEISVRYLAKRPNLLRMDSESPEIKVVRVFDGERAWQAIKQPGAPKQVTEMEGQEAVELVRESDFDGPLVDYKEKGHEIAFLGRETVQDREAYKLTLVEERGARETYYIDAESYQVVKKAADVSTRTGEILFEMYYDDFREVDGLMFPFETAVYSDGETVFTGVIEEVEVNPDLDGELFERPR